MSKKEIATLAGGCFWCLEAVFELVGGVDGVVSGYIGGHIVDPSYEDVCTGQSGHAEAVQISFDPDTVSFTDLLAVFFAIHDPTTLNRQGNDQGTQYRSAIFYHGETQREEAQAMIAALDSAQIWPAPLVTEVVTAPIFYPAEKYHQHYFSSHPEQGYCQFLIAPKVNKFREFIETQGQK